MSFTIYSSSAGSGKTFTLVREYIKIVLQDPSKFRQILAITFTNKSANELKERVVSSLKCISVPEAYNDTDVVRHLLPELIKDINLSQSEISSRAGMVLSNILHYYSDFAISTIDSFVYRIIRTFAYDLNIPFDFDVELEDENLISKAVDYLISQAGTNDELTSLLVSFTGSKTDDEKTWDIEKDIREFAVKMLDDESYGYIKRLSNISLTGFVPIIKTLKNGIFFFENSLFRIAQQVFQELDRRSVPLKCFHRYRSGIIKYFEYCFNHRFDKLEPGQHVYESIVNNKWHSRDCPEDQKQAVSQVIPFLVDSFRHMQRIIDQNHRHYRLLSLLYKNIYPLALLNEIDKVLEEIKSQNRVIHISEFNKKIAEVVLNEPVPFIYERIGERYEHFLIDEFQDTSLLQWQNLLPLIENSLAENNFNMVVGDGKQAIYRWRNGEVEQFTTLPGIYKRSNEPFMIEREQSLQRHHKKETLLLNYRSRDELVDFNNDFFAIMQDILPDHLRYIYANHIQSVDPPKKGGYIHLGFYDKEHHPENFATYNLNKIIEIIDELKSDGYQLPDITILCRANREASEIARHLLSLGIDVVSSESLLLDSSADVRFLMDVLQYLTEPTAIAEASMVHYLVKGDRVVLKKMADYYTMQLLPGQKRVPVTHQFYQFLSENGYNFSPHFLLQLPVYELIEELIRIFGLNREANPYLQFFLDVLLDYTIQHNEGISAFLSWWDENKSKLSIVVPEGADAVRIMTIHKAKGLQFSVVIFPFATATLRYSKEYLWIDFDENDLKPLDCAMVKTSGDMKDTEYEKLFNEENDKSILDLLNILYVVMTRAKDRMYILTKKSKNPPAEVKSVDAMFRYYLDRIGKWNSDQYIYTFGSKIKKDSGKNGKKRLQDSGGVELNSFITSGWRKRIYMGLKAPESWDVENPEKNRKWGNLVHLALSRIIHYSEVGQALEQINQEGLIELHEMDEIKTILQDFFDDPEIKDLFKEGYEVKTESEILQPDGKSYRPDRLLISENQTVIIDFKTGQHRESHVRQINNYGKLLKSMGYDNIRKFLLYTDQAEKIIEVA